MTQESPRTGTFSEWLDKAAALATIAILVVIVYRNAPSQTSPAGGNEPTYQSGKTTIQYDPALIEGRRDATVAVVVFADFECQFCARLATETIPNIRSTFVDSGKAFIVLKHAPGAARLVARDAAVATLCAGQQGQHWPYHDALFALDGRLRPDDPMNVWTRLGRGDVGKFRECIAAAVSGPIDADLAEARKLGLMSTPTTFFGRKEGEGEIRLISHIKGAKDFNVFAEEVRRALEVQ